MFLPVGLGRPVLPSFLRQGSVAALLVLAACGKVSGDAGPSDAGRGDANPPGSDSSISPVDAAKFGPASVLTGHGHPTRDGAYVDSNITRAAAAGLKLDTAFSATYAGTTYAQPLYVDNEPGRDALFVVTTANEVDAFDAQSGATLWSKTLGTPVPITSLPCNQAVAGPYGILSTPVIDEASRTLFTEAFVTEGDDGATLKHLAYALSIDDGSTRPGWPVDIASKLDGFSSMVQHQRGALLILDGTLFLPYSGVEFDCEPPTYHGWVVGISIADPTQVKSWATTANRGGIWGALASDGTDLFFATGNTGSYGVADGGPWGGGNAVIRLSTDLKFAAEDTTSFFSPSNWPFLDERDFDLGSSSLVLFDLPGATPSALAMATGKFGTAHLVDRANLGGFGTGDGTTGEGLFSAEVAKLGMKGNPATYETAQGRYVVVRADSTGIGCPNGTSGDLVALKVAATSPPSFAVAWCAVSQGLGSPMVTTTDGKSNPIVWVTGAQGTSLLLGFDGDTGDVVFDGGGATMNPILRWTSPIVAEGRFYVGAAGKLYAFDSQ